MTSYLGGGGLGIASATDSGAGKAPWTAKSAAHPVISSMLKNDIPIACLIMVEPSLPC
jgi:hypothetical protein